MNIKTGKNAQDLKAENRGLIFQYIVTREQTSRTELARISSLNKMTITNIISDFLEHRYIAESSATAARNTPIMLQLSPNAPKIIGLLIRHTHVSVALCNFRMDILAYESENINSACTKDALLQIVRVLVDRMMRFGNILGIGIGSIGPVDIKRGVILDPPDFYGIQDVRIVDCLQDIYHIPVSLEHHYNCVALTERYYGNAVNYHNFLFLGIDNGLGLGIIINNQLLSSFTGVGSDFGYLCVNFDDQTPREGIPSGNLGAYVSLESDDPKVLKNELSILGFALIGVCNLLNPDAIIVGDSKNILSDDALKSLSSQINSGILAKNHRHIDIRRSFRGGNFETACCAISIIHKVFSGQLLVNED